MALSLIFPHPPEDEKKKKNSCHLVFLAALHTLPPGFILRLVQHRHQHDIFGTAVQVAL